MSIRVLVRRLHVSASCRLRAMPRTMPRTLEEFHQSLATPPEHEGNQVRVALIGDPNVGKSTIINKLLARDICTVSKKPHTTRGLSPVALTTDDLQMVLVDTPGAVHDAHARKHKLPKDMVLAPKNALQDGVDVLVAVIDASDVYRREYLSIEMLRLLHKHRTEQPDACSVLVLNKVDKVKAKRELLDCIHSLSRGVVDNEPVRRVERGGPVDLKKKIWEKEERRSQSENEQEGAPQPVPGSSAELELSPENPDPGTYREQYPPRLEAWPHFQKVFLVSALENNGIDDLKQFLLSRATKGVWKYRKDFLTDQDPVKFVEDVVRSKLLEYTQREIPYQLKPRVIEWAEDGMTCLHITINIECTTERQAFYAVGKDGRVVKKVIDEVRQQLCGAFGCEVNLKIFVVNVKKEKK